MLNRAHIRQSGASGALGRPLNNFYAFDQRTVNLVPHFDAHAGELAAQKNGCVGATAPDVDADAGEGVARALADEQDVADACAFRVVFCEEAGAGAGGVEHADLRGGYGGDGVRAGFLDVAGGWLEDWDAELVTWGVGGG